VLLSAQKYTTGTMVFECKLTKNGKFIGLVKAISDDGKKEYISSFPFSVGETTSIDIQSIAVATFGYLPTVDTILGILKAEPAGSVVKLADTVAMKKSDSDPIQGHFVTKK
jgi:hypothetical protein